MEEMTEELARARLFEDGFDCGQAVFSHFAEELDLDEELALKIAARMIEDGELDKRIAQRYSGWNSELGQQILKGQMSLADLAKYAQEHNLSPVHQSGRQEQLENLVNHYLFDK